MPAGTISDGPRTARPPATATLQRLVPAWYRDVAGSLMWASLLVVTALWVAGGGIQNLAGFASALTSLGRLAGLLSADLLLVQGLLLARIPFVEQAYGQDELARRHRLVGFTSFNLMLAHIALTVLGYTGQGPLGLVAQTWDLVANYAGMLLATAASALLVLVVVTSVKASRAALRYESWHLLHLYAYLGIGLSVPHEVWTGADFVASPLSRLYWWSLYVAAAGAILVWRVGLPVYRSLRHRLVVHKVVREGSGVVSVYLRGQDLDLLGARAGQFFTWRFLDGPGWTRGHPYSLSAAPTRDQLRITVKNLGDGSARLAGLRPGTRVFLEGPYGRLHGGVRTRRRVTLLAGGIGVTPLRALMEELSYAPGELTLIYRARDARELVLRREIDDLATRRGAQVLYVLGHRLRSRASWLPESAGHLTDSDA
ncbi:MAG TPA: ferric reductase-like transmembrane domain-containing protein, partial [Kineosporiaceae bacterium]|nr:ferric reductase-like transmembrane domain-containing protein [Kineosporiaceae bacterium]